MVKFVDFVAPLLCMVDKDLIYAYLYSKIYLVHLLFRVATPETVVHLHFTYI